MSWLWQNLAFLDQRERVTPSIAGLVYPGRRHLWSGPPESGKTLLAYAVLLDHIRQGGRVALFDFEMGRFDAHDRLRDLGATDDELARLAYIEPEGLPMESFDGLIDEFGPDLVVIDAAAGVFGLLGLDDNKRADVELFHQTFIAPFWQREIASIVLDHVGKNTEGRGKYAIGSERKVGSVEVHLGFEAVDPLGRGRTGVIRITTHKDRLGYLQRPRAAEIEFSSDPETHAVTWAPREPDGSDFGSGNNWQPTKRMNEVSEYLQSQSRPVSRNNVEQHVTGTAKYTRQAIDRLIAEGYVQSQPGPRGSQLLTSISPFTASVSDRVDTAAETQSLRPRRTASPPSQGDTVDAEDAVNTDLDHRVAALSAELEAAPGPGGVAAVARDADADVLHALIAEAVPVNTP